MKKAKQLIVMFASLGLSLTTSAQTNKESFQVWGNCGMCKKTIEAAAQKAGTKTAEWNKETEQIVVVYDAKKLSGDIIQQQIALAGYDTEKFAADDNAYDNLHECCKYDRKPKK